MIDWVICLEGCLPDFGINLSSEKIKELAQIMADNADYISEMSFERRGGRSPDSFVDYKSLYENEKVKFLTAEKEINIYRESVANRRHVPVSNVWINGDTVMYKP